MKMEDKVLGKRKGGGVMREMRGCKYGQHVLDIFGKVKLSSCLYNYAC